jgi:hypothetical protein
MTSETLLAFDIGDICCGLPLAVVDRVEAAASFAGTTAGWFAPAAPL